MSAWVRREIKEKGLGMACQGRTPRRKICAYFGAGVLVGGQQQSKRKQDNGKLPILAQLARRICKGHGCGRIVWRRGMIASLHVVDAFASSSQWEDDNDVEQRRLLRRAAVAAPHAGDTF